MPHKEKASKERTVERKVEEKEADWASDTGCTKIATFYVKKKKKL